MSSGEIIRHDVSTPYNHGWLAEIGINMWLSGVGRWEFSDKYDPD